MKNIKIVEMTKSEAKAVNGGGWISYALGFLAATLEHFGDKANDVMNSDEQAAVNQALNDFG